MIPEDRLTAYALDDPGLTPEERESIAAHLTADPAARDEVAAVRALAGALTAGLAAEQAAVPAVPLSLVPRRGSRRWAAYAVSAAAAVLVVGALAVPLLDRTRGGMDRRPREVASDRPAAPGPPAVSPVPGPAWTPAGTPPGGGSGGPGGAPSFAGGRGASGPQAGSPGGAAAPVDGKPAEAEKAQPKVAKALPSPLRPTDAVTPPGSGAPGAPGDPQSGQGVVEGVPGGSPPGRGGSQPAPGLAPPGGVAVATGAGGSGKELEDRKAALAAALERARWHEQAQRQAVGRVAVSEPRPGGPAGKGDAAKNVKDGYNPTAGGFERDNDYRTPVSPPGAHGPGDKFPQLIENDFVTVAGLDALSTFGADVDTASYSVIRNHLNHGQMPPADAVRLEEVVNYFPYGDKAPENDDPFAVTVEVGQCPWQPGHRLARIGLKAKPIAADKRPPSNLVFLIDVSGSMAPENRLPLVKQSLRLLVSQLGENDRVAMVVYAGNSGLVLDSTSATNKTRILEALDRLDVGGSTNGAGGLRQAYDVASQNFIKNGTNRVILCTDGDWNVGTTSTEELVKLVEDKRQTGVFLSVFGFGMGNLRDEMMVKLAGKGNGNYGYVDTLREAHKALVEQLSGTLVTVAKDVKLQVEFNPAAVKAYRLLGYEKRALAAADFANDKKDAGEMGAGHVVTALYELVPAGEPAAADPADGLRYQPKPAVAAVKTEKATEAFVVKMRHKKPDGDKSVLRELPVANTSKPAAEASEDFRFAAAAASFALVLRESPHKGQATFALAADLASGATKFDPSGYRAEFLEVVRKAQRLSGKP